MTLCVTMLEGKQIENFMTGKSYINLYEELFSARVHIMQMIGDSYMEKFARAVSLTKITVSVHYVQANFPQSDSTV